MTFRVALLQMEIHDADVARNVSTAKQMMQGGDADLYLLPELWTSGYAHDSWPTTATAVEKTVAQLHDWARSWHAWIGGTMVSLNATGKLCNRFWLVGPEGQQHSYDKIHLFPPMKEDMHMDAGTRPVSFDLGDCRTSLSICFDLRFPKMYISQAAEGTALFLVSAEWPHPRTQIMRTLAAARAIECQAYVAVCNRIGLASDGTKFCGGSAIFAPDGSVIADAGSAPALVSGEIDLGLVRSVRAHLPMTRLASRYTDIP